MSIDAVFKYIHPDIDPLVTNFHFVPLFSVQHTFSKYCDLFDTIFESMHEFCHAISHFISKTFEYWPIAKEKCGYNAENIELCYMRKGTTVLKQIQIVGTHKMVRKISNQQFHKKNSVKMLRTRKKMSINNLYSPFLQTKILF